MKLEEFISEIADSVVTFQKNMEDLEFDKDVSYADWFDTFRAWCEVGTSMEYQYHGERAEPRREDEEPLIY